MAAFSWSELAVPFLMAVTRRLPVHRRNRLPSSQWRQRAWPGGRCWCGAAPARFAARRGPSCISSASPWCPPPPAGRRGTGPCRCRRFQTPAPHFPGRFPGPSSFCSVSSMASVKSSCFWARRVTLEGSSLRSVSTSFSWLWVFQAVVYAFQRIFQPCGITADLHGDALDSVATGYTSLLKRR